MLNKKYRGYIKKVVRLVRITKISFSSGITNCLEKVVRKCFGWLENG
jgi:hypothetical protein